MGTMWPHLLEPDRRNGVLKVVGSPHIATVIIEARNLAVAQNRTVTFEFNDIVVSVDKDSSPELIRRDFDRALEHCIDRHIGPHSEVTLSGVVQMEDAIIRAIMKRRRDEAYAKQFSRT